MKRLSYNHVIQTISQRTNGWLTINQDSGWYRLQEYSHTYSDAINALESGTLRDIWNYYQKMDKSRYDFLPDHNFYGIDITGLEKVAVKELAADILDSGEEFKTHGYVSMGLHDNPLNSGFCNYYSYYKLPVSLFKEGDTVTYYNHELLSKDLLLLKSNADWQFSPKVKTWTVDDHIKYEKLPIFIFDHDYTKAETAVVTDLYNKYVEPICPGLATTYKLKSDIINRGKRPNLAQSMHQTVRWIIEYKSKGEMTNEIASGFFFAHLDSTEPIREFFKAFYVQKS